MKLPSEMGHAAVGYTSRLVTHTLMFRKYKRHKSPLDYRAIPLKTDRISSTRRTSRGSFLTHPELVFKPKSPNLDQNMSKSSAPSGLAGIMGSDKYSDLKFVCQGQEFKVHKAIVCTQSPVLAAACDGSFQVKTAKTAQVGLTLTSI